MSELADELKMDPGNMARQVKLYYTLREDDRPSRLDPQAVEHLRAAHRLVVSGAVRNYPQALRQVLGLTEVPVPSAVLKEILQSLEGVRDSQLRTEKRLNSMAKAFKALLIQSDKQGRLDDPNAVDESSDPT
ncbi:hypothetical protein ACFOME_03760 [Deinococcus metalli]|nr:hypothetical protein GCM10017781_41540 [Deinococcus metalli]